MERFIVLDKKLGRTPLETVEAWRALHPEYAGIPLSYAGRLDPLAEGKLLVLLGDECKRQKAYAGLDKEYEVTVLLGAASDTGDLMGIPSLARPMVEPTAREIRAAAKTEIGTHERAYPAFSSKTVDGVPLFEHALRGTLPSTLPTHLETIHAIRLRSIERITAKDLLAHIERTLAFVTHDPDPRKTLGADFRRGEILARWHELLACSSASFPIIKFTVSCASGAYMRSLAGRIGSSLGSNGLAYSIKRTRIGRYYALDPIRFWWPNF